jgi:hypothetical protein
MKIEKGGEIHEQKKLHKSYIEFNNNEKSIS